MKKHEPQIPEEIPTKNFKKKIKFRLRVQNDKETEKEVKEFFKDHGTPSRVR